MLRADTATRTNAFQRNIGRLSRDVDQLSPFLARDSGVSRTSAYSTENPKQ